MDQNALIECRTEPGNKAAIVFIHGGSGDPKESWGRFPEFLAADPRASGWDIFSYGYISTGLTRMWSLPWVDRLLRLLGIRRDPDISMLTNGFYTRLTTEPFRNYAALAVISHSLGGLVSQSLLVEYPDMRARIRFLFLFGVSSNGFTDKLLLTRWMPQIQEIRPGSPFITGLRSRWKALFIDKPAPFEYWAVAGDQDGFVSSDSSLGPYPPDRRRVVPGDHETMKDPQDAANLVVQFVLERLAGQLSGDRWGTARAAVELGEYQEAIARLEPYLADLDSDGIVTLALAYESVGRADDALRALSQIGKYRDGTDAMGVLAGRLKRRWLLNRTASDAERALELYSEAYQRAVAKGRSDQAGYHGINVAFMQLAYRRDGAAAAETAKAVLAHCEKCTLDYWRLATEGEAYLYLSRPDAAIERYRSALASDRPPRLRERNTMYQQAMRALSYLPGLARVRVDLDNVFG